jgi:hypothetical protein
MIVANEDDIGGSQSLFNFAGRKNSAVRLEGFTEIAQVLSPTLGVGSSNGSLYFGQRVKLRGATAKAE